MPSEDEARKMWCPMIRWYGNGNRYEDVFNNRGKNCYCIASECAMWRWNDFNSRMLGYCGIAGKEY